METAVSYRCLLMSVAAACGEAKDLIMQNGGPDIAKYDFVLFIIAGLIRLEDF